MDTLAYLVRIASLSSVDPITTSELPLWLKLLQQTYCAVMVHAILKEMIPLRNYLCLAKVIQKERDEKPRKAFWVPVLALSIYFHTCKQNETT